MVGLILAAALANAAMVWLSLQGRRDLVRSDYYQAGLEQDARLARRALADAHAASLSMDGGEWTVTANGTAPGPETTPPQGQLPAAGNAGGIPPASRAAPSLPAPGLAADMLPGSVCRVRLSRPEDGRLDRVVDLAWVEGSRGLWRGPGIGLKTGRWDVLVEWEKDGKVFMESAFPRYVHE